jgi:hypothetical protein
MALKKTINLQVLSSSGECCRKINLRALSLPHSLQYNQEDLDPCLCSQMAFAAEILKGFVLKIPERDP